MRGSKQARPSPFSTSHRNGRSEDSAKIFSSIRSGSKSENREDVISQDAIRNVRAAITGTPAENSLDEGLVGISSRGLISRRTEELVMSDRHMDKMSDTLTKQAKINARARIQAMRSGQQMEDDEELPGLHKAQKISFEGRCVKVHLGSRGTAGKNFVALPELSQTEDAAVRMVRGVNLVELDLTKDGKQNIPYNVDGLIKGARNLRLELCFSDQREHLRDKTSDRGIE